MVIKHSKYNRGITPIKLNLDLMTYDLLCRYVLQNSAFLRMEHLVKLRNLLSIIDYSSYQNDPEKSKRVDFLIKALEARLDNNINDRDVILSYVNGGLTYPIEFIDMNRIDLTRDEINYLHSLVADTLQFSFLYSKVDEVQDLCTRFKTTEYSNRGNIVKEIENTVDDLKNSFRIAKVNDNLTNMSFSLVEGEFESAVTDIYNIVSNPSRRLKTGMQGVNQIIGGGFESGRVYMLLGTSGVGKSITLLNFAYQLKKYNTHIRPKDPTKIPCIVLLTMENTVVETVTRLFDMLIEEPGDMKEYPLPVVIEKLRNEGQLRINDSSPLDIVIKYKPNKSVDTSYLYSLYDDLLDEGREMVCLIQDHIKRIRSSYGNQDLRLELGDIVNELKVFAAEKDIPVITNSHLNREASRKIEDGSNKNKEVGKLLGKSDTGESMLMIDNLDVAININLDFDKNGNKYMSFNCTKMRDKSERSYIAQPFAKGFNNIRLLEDEGSIPQFRESIHGVPENKSNNTYSSINMSGTSTLTANMNDVIKIENDDLKNNSFVTRSKYSLDESTKRRIIIKPIEFISRDMMPVSDFKSDLDNLINNSPMKTNTLVETIPLFRDKVNDNSNMVNITNPIDFDNSLKVI